MVMPSKQTVSAHSAKAQKAAALLSKQKKELSISPKTKAAIELMVFEGRKRTDAAKEAGIHDDTLRLALRKTEVLAYLNELQEVLRNSLRPRALHTMGELLDEKETGTVRFKAAEYLDGQNRGQHTIGATQINVQVNNTTNVTPGYMVKLDRSGGAQIEHLGKGEGNPLPHMQDVPEDD
jgi:hypothetical protein